MQKQIDVTLTSSEGCTVGIKGTVDFSLFPPSIDGFTGTVTISGAQVVQMGL